MLPGNSLPKAFECGEVRVADVVLRIRFPCIGSLFTLTQCNTTDIPAASIRSALDSERDRDTQRSLGGGRPYFILDREAGPLEEPMLDYRAEEELQAQLDDGDDPIAKLQDGEDGSESPYTKALAEVCLQTLHIMHRIYLQNLPGLCFQDPMVMQNKAQVASDMDAVTKIPYVPLIIQPMSMLILEVFPNSSDASASSGSQSG